MRHAPRRTSSPRPARTRSDFLPPQLQRRVFLSEAAVLLIATALNSYLCSLQIEEVFTEEQILELQSDDKEAVDLT